MKERPILFSAPMVRAILDGRKTQTRRIVKPQPLNAIFHQGKWVQAPCELDKETHILHCKYGQPGDRLWVRETWQYDNWTEDGYPWIGYAADSARILIEDLPSDEWAERLLMTWADLSDEKNYSIDGRAADRRWRPSIHMPRWASRITLEITGVRVERLQDISQNDAIAEGLHSEECRWGDCEYPLPDIGYLSSKESPARFSDPRQAYRHLWESINGPGSWEANPWVWVVEFKLVQP